MPIFFQKAKEELVGTAFTLNMPDEDLKKFRQVPSESVVKLSLLLKSNIVVVLPDGQMRVVASLGQGFF